MPRYYFDVHDGADCPDLCGVDLADIAAARQMAMRYAGELIAASDGWRSAAYHWKLEVCDDLGLPIMRLALDSVHGRFMIHYHSDGPRTPVEALF
ncbi:DUF6894 family protein [Sphingomonas crocodyli]|uniref:DUF6894 domain-containing protein n=1 Tax=Sphingomonas crocodyli TaxID=1979270 RepID=A0A437LYK0_9SPHN|nr:hypothetical protein [Sphingomonas crocodyli]RVT90426.1 hypothetical protein EOD43_19400 [Sphingomonas crocodyli]